MKKIAAILIFIFFCAASVYAAPCYGTRMPEKNHISLGLQNYTLDKRYLEGDNGQMRSMQDFLLLSYGVFDWLVIDLKGGSGNLEQHGGRTGRIDYSTYLAGGYGFRIRVFEKDKFKSVFGFQHISVHPNTKYIGLSKNKAVLDDWQFSLLISRSFARITPYLGTKWSRQDYIHWTDGTRKLIKSDLDKSVGIIFGFDLPITKAVWLNFEGQALDSYAGAASINYGF